ncbi:putative N-6 adenine-specific DNA methylase [Tetraselmis virus 1]|uniref:site-specific DNA-methyltransferase (adenine-specific) n=1 Tax=Tetraselmis virus 1 TaxID=2060617 RepID=A0A2P0VNA3_9VIRU|nr:putative N-6 adenine-specific DNA methylase [Tetraselmis virus 1]AUF82382.1 putative N-6 adenine-specific DNA methylase [Tetraselmis virus 1]
MIEEIIEKYYIIDNDKKRDLGEIFTPLELVKKMLDQLPSSVWKNPELKWLDPCAGFGVFSVEVYSRLMRSLKSSFEDESRRSKHIVENMLFNVEIDKKNEDSLKQIFYELDPSATPNVWRLDFFSWADPHLNNSFDVIMGNPPYNLNGLNKGGTYHIPYWAMFCLRCCDLLKKGGYLTFVHPPGWRKPSGITKSAGDVLKKYIKEGGLRFLSVNDTRNAPFPPVDYYVYKKGRRERKTATRCTFQGVSYKESVHDFSSASFIPNMITDSSESILKKIINKPGHSPFNFIRDNRFRFPVSQTKAKGIPHVYYYENNTYKLVNLSENQMKQMNGEKIPDYYTKPKIVISFDKPKKVGELYPVFYDGKHPIGTTTNVAYEIIDPKKAELYVSFLSSKLITFLMRITQYSSPPNRKNDLKVLNNIKRPNYRKIKTDEDIYKHYSLTKPEIDLINQIVDY